MRAVVITPTVGEPTLAAAIASVANQTVPVRHLIVVDGPQHLGSVIALLDRTLSRHAHVDLMALPQPTGNDGFFGHLAIASAAYSAKEEVFFLLDSDNVYSQNHVETCLAALEGANADWCYALRHFVDEAGRYLFDDDGESLGFWPRAMSLQAPRGWHRPDEARFVSENPYLVDTSCFCVRRPTFLRHAWAWNNGHGADAIFAKALIQSASGVSTGLSTVGYRISAERMQVLVHHFQTCNHSMIELYGPERPWRKRDNSFVTPPIQPHVLG